MRAYNDASIEVMTRKDVPVTDMFSALWREGVESVLIGDGVHLAHRGSVILEVVANAVRVCL